MNSPLIITSLYDDVLLIVLENISIVGELSVVSIETEYVFKLGISKGTGMYTLIKIFDKSLLI